MKVVVIGAGYAGAIAANRLVKKADAEVTVVNPRPGFVERVRLHEHIAGSGTAVTPLTEMLDPRIRLVVGSVDKIGDGTLLLADGTSLPFDRAIYAAGGAPTAPSGAFAVGALETAEEAHRALSALPDGSGVTVVGGGLTGIETAAEVAESRPGLRVRLLSEARSGRRSGPARGRGSGASSTASASWWSAAGSTAPTVPTSCCGRSRPRSATSRRAAASPSTTPGA